jgi:hypothetical protein
MALKIKGGRSILWKPETVALPLTETTPFCSNTDVRHDPCGTVSAWAVFFAILKNLKDIMDIERSK